jgi:hypothetical protein
MPISNSNKGLSKWYPLCGLIIYFILTIKAGRQAEEERES